MYLLCFSCSEAFLPCIFIQDLKSVQVRQGAGSEEVEADMLASEAAAEAANGKGEAAP